VPARGTRGDKAAKREQRVDVDRIEFLHMFVQPALQTERNLVRKQITPKEKVRHSIVVDCMFERHIQASAIAIVIRGRDCDINAGQL
jgi:hypothetical protein